MEQNTNTRNKTLQLSTFALYMAIICIVTMFTKIPIPLGYAHIGDSIILTFALFYGGKNGFVVPNMVKERIRSYELSDFTRRNEKVIRKLLG